MFYGFRLEGCRGLRGFGFRVSDTLGSESRARNTEGVRSNEATVVSRWRASTDVRKQGYRV